MQAKKIIANAIIGRRAEKSFTAETQSDAEILSAMLGETAASRRRKND